MKLTYNEFEILVCIEKEKRELSQREISKTTNLSLGTVNKTITSLLEKKLINEDNTITKRGLKELEPYRVKRAIFLAAGFGSRLVPITLNTPKPLVLVNGKKIIETLLDAVVKAEIPEIIIVTGYLNEQFEILLKKYPNIILDSIKRKFPDAKIDENKSSYLGSYPGHYLKISYTIKNFDTKFNCVSICLLSIKDNKLYTVLFETQKEFFNNTINEFRGMIASFSFTS